MCTINLRRGFWQQLSIQEVLQPVRVRSRAAHKLSLLKNYLDSQKVWMESLGVLLGQKVRQIVGGEGAGGEKQQNKAIEREEGAEG